MKIDLVTSMEAISRHDQATANIRETIGRLSKESHHVILGRLAVMRMMAVTAFESGDISEEDYCAILIAVSAGVIAMNESAIERWGRNGTEARDER